MAEIFMSNFGEKNHNLAKFKDTGALMRACILFGTDSILFVRLLDDASTPRVKVAEDAVKLDLRYKEATILVRNVL